MRSNHNVATFIKELVLELPEGEEVPFRAGGFIQIERPPKLSIDFKDFNVEEEYRSDWDHHNLWRYRSECHESVTRAYSMANYPEEKGIIMLNVSNRYPSSLPFPMWNRERCPPIFSISNRENPVTISGPFGEFFARETDKEMIFYRWRCRDGPHALPPL